VQETIGDTKGYTKITEGPNAGMYQGEAKFAFDPVSQQYYRTDKLFNYVEPINSFRFGASQGFNSSNAFGGGDNLDSNPGWSALSDAEKAAYYAENPTMAAITQAGQKALDYTLMGQAAKAGQNYFDPGFRARQEMISMGLNPDQDFGMGFNYNDDYDSFASERGGGGGGSWSDMGGGMVGSQDTGYDGNWAQGGLLGLAKGGMKSGGFVIPADVVSMVGEGNTDAGYARIKSMVPGATAIKGKDGGQADTVKTSIEGKQPARVAHGEMYVPPETVKRMGGAKKLYAMMDKVRAQATGSKKQIKPVSLKKALA